MHEIGTPSPLRKATTKGVVLCKNTNTENYKSLRQDTAGPFRAVL